MKKEEMNKKADKALDVLQKQSTKLESKMGVAKKKLGEFSPAVMIAVGVSLLMAVLYHPNSIVVGVVVGLIVAMPVIKKKLESKKKSEKKTESKGKTSKAVKAEVVEDTKPEEKA